MNRFWISSIIFNLMFIFSVSSPGLAEESYDEAISNAVVFVVKELKYSNKLDGKRLAVYGFVDGETDEGCPALSKSLADKITSKIHLLKNIVDVKYDVVARRDIEAIETEYMISQKDTKKGLEDVMALLEESDILITGSWQKGYGSFTLRLHKKVENGVR